MVCKGCPNFGVWAIEAVLEEGSQTVAQTSGDLEYAKVYAIEVRNKIAKPVRVINTSNNETLFELNEHGEIVFEA